MVAPTVKLSSGREMPLVGFGLWKVTEGTADTVYNAIKAGYRLFDGACDYGNEVEAGKGVARAIKDGLVKREDLFLVSKLWNSFHEEERVKPICKKQLQDWGIDYFDLYIVHFPIALEYVDPSVRYPPGWSNKDNKTAFAKAPLYTTWRAMETLVDEGLAKSIGVSNYSLPLMMDLERYARIMPSTLQIEHHPYLTQKLLVDWCTEKNIHVTAYSSFGPMSYREMNMAEDVPLLFENPTVTDIAKKHNKDASQVLLRWATQRNVAVIPKSNNPGRLAANLDVCSFDLTKDEIESISKLDKHLRFNDPIAYGIPAPIFA